MKADSIQEVKDPAPPTNNRENLKKKQSLIVTPVGDKNYHDDKNPNNNSSSFSMMAKHGPGTVIHQHPNSFTLGITGK